MTGSPAVSRTHICTRHCDYCRSIKLWGLSRPAPCSLKVWVPLQVVRSEDWGRAGQRNRAHHRKLRSAVVPRLQHIHVHRECALCSITAVTGILIKCTSAWATNSCTSARPLLAASSKDCSSMHGVALEPAGSMICLQQAARSVRVQQLLVHICEDACMTHVVWQTKLSLALSEQHDF